MILDHLGNEFVDVDFTKFPEFVHGNNGPGDLSRFADYESDFPVISESDYKKYIELEEAGVGGVEWLITRIFNQGDREGSCVGNAETQMGEVLQALQFGLNNVIKLSAISAYQLIGSSPNSGANVSDAMEAFQKRGIIPLDCPENRAKFGDVVMPHTGFYSKRPSGWEAVAANFKLTSVHVIRSVAAMCSALDKRPVVVGRSGHSILYIKLAYHNGNLGAIYANSWDYSFGFPLGNMKGGFGFDSLGMMRSASQWAFCGHGMTIPPWIKMGVT